MRVPVKQRVSRSSPASAATSRTKNKRRVSSDGAPPVKTKKRKLPPPPVDALPDASASGPVAGVVVVPPKRKPIKKPTSAVKKGVGEGAVPKVTAKKPKVVKGVDMKLTVSVKGKVVAKKVSVAFEKKIVGVKIAKKLQNRKLSTASMDGVGDVARDMPILEKGVAEQPSVVPKKASKKAAKVVAGDGKAKTPRVKVKEDAAAVAVVVASVSPAAAGATPTAGQAAKKKAGKSEKKGGVKKVGDGKRAKATPDGKKTRRKSASDGVGADEAVSDPSASMFANSQFDVIDDVARNLTKGAVAAAAAAAAVAIAPKKTKESDEKESSSAIKNKIVGGKNKKQLTKKTPKSVDEVAGKKVDGVANEISDVAAPATINDGGEKPEINLPDKDLLDKEIKSKIVIKKSLKEKKPQVNIIKKKVMFKKTSTKVGAAVKPAKVTFKVKESEQQSSKKRPPKKGKKSSDGQQVAGGGSSFQDDYNSSTSDDCTLDLLLRRQKQLKQEELNATTTTPTPKSCGVDVKPAVATSVKAETTPTVTASTKSKIKTKIASKSADAVTSAVKKFVKKPFVSKSKTQPLVAKKKASSTLNKLKLAAARKKAIVSKVKRMRSNEVSKLGSGSESEQRARRMKLFGFWSGPKRHRVASLNALAKVHCLYENESRGALMSVCAKPASPEDSSGGEEKPDIKTETVNTRTLRSGPGRRGIGQHWDQQTTSSSSSSEDNGHHSDSSTTPAALNLQPSYKQKQLKAKAAKPIKKASKPRRHEAVMDLKDMVVRKRMASLNASAILSASYSPIEKLQKKQRSVKDDDSPQQVENDDDSHVRKKKCKKKIHLSKKLIEGEETDEEGRNIIELATSNNKKVATVIVNQDTDVTITGVYVNSTTHRSSTTHEGYCSIAGMQYLISSTSHTKTEARAVATETLLHAPTELVPPVPTLHPPEQPLQPPMKSYTPLGALSIMQPPGGPMSPLARRHGCASAFSAPPLVPPVPPTVAPPPPPHHHHHHAPPAPEPPAPPYLHGYYQPAGPLISAHHHQHSLPKASVLPTLEASPTSTPPTNTSSAPPPVSASTSSGTRGGDESSDNDVVITASSCHNPTYPAGPPSQSAPTYRYQTYPLPPAPQHHQYGYPSQYPAPQYYPVAGSQGGGYAPAPPHYHNPDLCYTTPNYPPAPQYYHKSYSTPPPVTYPRRYGPPPPPPHPAQYYPAELYPPPPEQQAGRQMVATASTSYQQPPPGDAYPHPQQPPPPVVPMVDSYPPPPAPGYYPGYPPPAPPPCYSHSPPARSLAYIDTAYQGCPCPMQSCPKNVNTGPLTGEGKGPRPSAAYIHHLPLPPVALALPSEPPHAGGPPSPARGSAGMHPTPSPCLATAQGSDAVACHPAKREQATSESRAVSAEPSSLENHVGLLTIHKAPSEPKATVLEVGSVAGAGTVHVGKDLTLTRCNGARPLDCGRVEAKVEKTVKLEVVGSVEDDVKAAVGNVRKRKMKTECSTAPKPKKRNVAATKRPAAKSRQTSPAANIVETDCKVASLKTKCKNQPLSSANSCSLHHSKQNAKRRKLSNVEELAENQEPTPLAAAAKGKPTAAKAKSKEPKPPNRPRLCPPSQAPTKARNVKVNKKSAGIVEEPAKTLTCDLTATTLGSNGFVVPPPPAKNGAKSGQKMVPKAAPVRRRLTKCQLKNIQRQVVDNVDETILDVVKMAVEGIRKKLAPKPKLGKLQNVPNCVLAEVGKVKNRRKTDSDVPKASHMLRSHGIQDMWVPPAPPSAAAKKSKARKPARKKAVPSVEVSSVALTLKRGYSLKPKWSNGWCWEGDSFHGKVLLSSEGSGVERVCFPAMRHVEGDIVRPLDCILLRSGGRRSELPYIAKVGQMWENPDDGEMMLSVLWYYRPEHTDHGRRTEDMFDEVFASKHKDANSVACIEEKCYVLTFNEYCRYRAGLRRQQDCGRDLSLLVPQTEEYPRTSRQPSSSVSPDVVFFCRRVYDFRQKRILKNPC